MCIRDREAAGAFAIVIECVPARVAQLVTEAVGIPTIGIGAGPHTDGQVLVYHDLLGMMQHHHHAKVAPKFCKQYASVGEHIEAALLEYTQEVKAEVFPGSDYSPYTMPQEQFELFREQAAALLNEEHERGYAGSPGDKGDQVAFTQGEKELADVEDEPVKVY
eukprot:TRINITY_DN21113_c0_g1_i1.p1 TRINITY_DN21113_c0_g1~~TRINITY_DN21113_c0_g1_i1.p1  ORF type:complete len:163 (+),score=58.86 TRINITY_DN21113_c0_g1_i1:123-611(+)